VASALLANIATNPFGPAAGVLANFAHDVDLQDAARAIEACARVSRKRSEDSERLEVAHEIRDLVAISGMSQRRFARYIGTSGPRLSTYVNGLVTPSATMMVRIRRCAAELAPVR
jgi:DNA-binding transcriptional regulator YiaG